MSSTEISAREVEESIARIKAEVASDSAIEAALARLAELKDKSLTDHQYELRNQTYREREARFRLIQKPDPRAAEIAQFRDRYAREQRAIKQANAELESLGYEPEKLHPAPGQNSHAHVMRELRRSARRVLS